MQYLQIIPPDEDEIRLFNDASISKMICVKTPDMYTVYIIARDNDNGLHLVLMCVSSETVFLVDCYLVSYGV